MSGAAGPFLEVADLAKSFGGAAVLRGVSFELGQGRTLGVLGKSGCGKTTLLKLLAGLQAPDGGRVRLGGRDITRTPVEKRDVVYLYQEPLLFPHLSVFENVAFGLRLRREEPGLETRVDRMLASLDLEAHRGKAPHQLSGGQRQRVSFGRALMVRPALLLLDEPFGSLDSDTRGQMQELFQRVAAEYGITAVFVTHDLKEALRVGDSFAVIREGTLRRYASREDFVADPDSGVAQELDFWMGLRQGRP
ncbi:MAG TPA: ABC transporter ATP-binding protein [Vicinamibacteria bacterium]